MVRENKFNDINDTQEASAEKLMETILEDVINATSMPFAEWHALSANPFVPLAIPVSENRQYPVTQVGVDAAHMLTQKSWKLREDLRQIIDRQAFNKLSFRAIGDTLNDCRLRLLEMPNVTDQQEEYPDAKFYIGLVADYKAHLQRLVDKSGLDANWHIPCHLFHTDQAVPAFNVGPVQFQPRAEWIDQFVKDPDVRAIVLQVETRQMVIEDLIAQSTATVGGDNSLQALDVLRTLSHYNWVATIKMEGHEHSRSYFKASVLVGLAIDAIGLRFHVEDARKFTKAGRQHLFAEDRFATTLDGRIFRGSSVQMPGVRGRPGALAIKMASEQSFLDASGYVLQHYIDGRRKGQALHIVEHWANALYWVGEARRESSDFMAVVNYGCAADGLSNAGGKAKQMISFAEKALQPEDTCAPNDGLTVSSAVHKVYREGRNKIAHGEMSGLLEDLADSRLIGDSLLSSLFDAVTPVLADLLQNDVRIHRLDEINAYRLLEAKLKLQKSKTE